MHCAAQLDGKRLSSTGKDYSTGLKANPVLARTDVLVKFYFF